MTNEILQWHEMCWSLCLADCSHLASAFLPLLQCPLSPFPQAPPGCLPAQTMTAKYPCCIAGFLTSFKFFLQATFTTMPSNCHHLLMRGLLCIRILSLLYFLSPAAFHPVALACYADCELSGVPTALFLACLHSVYHGGALILDWGPITQITR